MTKLFHNNAPITVAFMFMCIFLFVADVATSGFGTMLMASPATFQVLNPLTYSGMLSYVFVHANVEHIVGNLLLFLLIFPSLEERYGSGAMLFMMGITAVITACCNMILFDDSMIGASGIVFMGIALSGFTNRKRGSIPITAVFVCCIYMGSEVWGSLQEDNISQFGHLMGGLMGILFGIKLTPNYLHTNNNYDSYGK